jgi:AraC-like DNA-binding protein
MEKERKIDHDYQYSSLKDWLDNFASKLNTSSLNNKVDFPHSFGKGFIEIGQIMPGIAYRLANYKLNQDFEVNFSSSESFSLFIHFHKYISGGDFALTIGDSKLTHDQPELKLAVMNSSRVPLNRTLKKGTLVNGVTIQISEEWLVNNVKAFNEKNYETLVNTDHFINILSAKQEKLLKNLFEGHRTANIPSLFISTRLLRLMETFLEYRLKPSNGKEKPQLTSADIEGIIKVEALLLENYKEDFPSITSLSKLAQMSESKLKKVFKKAFGMGIFEYYQKNRMHKARELLISGKHSISEVGNILGYANLSNFSSSFKKEFDMVPKKFLESITE